MNATKKTLLIAALLTLCCHCMAQFDKQDVLDKGIVVVDILTVNEEEPTCDFIQAPTGCMGISTTNDTKVPGRLLLLKKNEAEIDTLYDSGDYIEKTSGIKIKIRGNTSAYDYQAIRKFPFKISLQKKADLLCRADARYSDKDWVLLNTANKFGNDVGRKLSALMGMEYTPAFEYVHVFINNNYRGLYLLSENVKRNSDCRIDVNKNTGYIIEHDAYWWNEDLSFGETFAPRFKYTFKYPDSEDVTTEQLEYISGAMSAMEESIYNGNYEEYIDTQSFARWLLAEDILGSWDGGGVNLFMAKKDDSSSSKFTIPCMWDYDSSFEIGFNNWSALHGRFLFNELFNSHNRNFAKAYKQCWEENGEWYCNEILNYIDGFCNDEQFQAISNSFLLEENWYRAQGVGYLAGKFSRWVTIAKEWFAKRAQWLNEQVDKIDTETSINDVRTDQQSDSSDTLYDLCGRRIYGKPSSGIYIYKNRCISIVR